MKRVMSEGSSQITSITERGKQRERWSAFPSESVCGEGYTTNSRCDGEDDDCDSDGAGVDTTDADGEKDGGLNALSFCPVLIPCFLLVIAMLCIRTQLRGCSDTVM